MLVASGIVQIKLSLYFRSAVLRVPAHMLYSIPSPMLRCPIVVR